MYADNGGGRGGPRPDAGAEETQHTQGEEGLGTLEYAFFC